MADRVRMTSKSVFQNEKITVFREGGPAEGEAGIPVTVGDAFETDLAHAQELVRLDLAEAQNDKDLTGTPAALEPHFQVSAPDLAKDQAQRAAEAEAQAKAKAKADKPKSA